MLRTFNSVISVICALALVLFIGACESKTEYAAENVAFENAVEENFDAADVAADNALDTAGNAVENADAAVNIDDASANADAPPLANPPATDTGPADVEEGVGAFTKLPDMEVDNWYIVEFSVAPGEAALIKQTEDRELTSPQPIYVASFMRVTLQGDPGIEIRPSTTEPVRTGKDKAESWQWSVKPLTDGERTLYAKVEVLEQLPNGKLDTIDTYTRRVAVQVKVGTWKGFLIAIRNAASLGDALATLFASWEKTLLALGALITAAGGVWLAIQKWGKAGP